MTAPRPHTLLRLATLTLALLAATLWADSHLAPRLWGHDDYTTHTALALDHGQFFYVAWGVGRAPWEDPASDLPTTWISPTLPADCRNFPASAAGLGFRFFTGRLHNDVRCAPATLLVLPLWLPTTIATLLLLITWPARHPEPQPVPTRPIPAPRFATPTPTIIPTHN